MGAQTIRFLIQLTCAFAALAVVWYVDVPYGPTLGMFLLVAGLWIGRRVYRRVARLDEEKEELRRRLDNRR